MAPLALGIDLGTSGVRIALINGKGALLHTAATAYTHNLCHPQDWAEATRVLIESIAADLRIRIQSVAVDGTSGTLLACTQQGDPLGQALAYSEACPEQMEQLEDLATDGGPAASSSGSLARALRLIEQHGETVLLRHQADWVTGWLLQDWRWGEEGNNLRLGWHLQDQRWPQGMLGSSWHHALPQVRASGSLLGTINPEVAASLGLSNEVSIVAGTTDSNAAVLAADPGDDDGVTVLGTTLVMKRFTDQPLKGAGITSHRVGGRWLCGGASNSGGGVLQQQFPGIDLAELSRQIDPERSSGLNYRPLPAIGERFPQDDPFCEPVLTPRPVSDVRHLHGLLEGMARIESEGWAKLTALGALPPQRVISIGGGARNPQWRRIRERVLGCPVVSSQAPPAQGVARLARLAFTS